DLRPASQPNVEITSYEKGKDLEYKLSVELMPEIETVDFSTLELERVTAEPSDEDINDALSRMAEGQKESAPIETARPAASGD
ncbi:peptidylprolyl isomerase, partial [bacterium LRH843]|nr:peptidylprolyl isomerase [bacterium LRH843]